MHVLNSLSSVHPRSFFVEVSPHTCRLFLRVGPPKEEDGREGEGETGGRWSFGAEGSDQHFI